MKVLAVVEVDLDRSPLGTKSRLADPLVGQPVLRRTLQRMLDAQLGPIYVVCAPSQRGPVSALVDGLDVSVETHQGGLPPYERIVQTARKWGLDSWRGGISGTCVFDESIHCGVSAALAERESADSVVSVPAAAVLFDAPLAREMALHFDRYADAMRLTFAQAPPGLVGTWYKADLLAELANAGIPPGVLMAYDPARPQFDFVVKDCCYKVPPSIAGASGRLLADTRRGFERCEQAITELGDALHADDSAPTLCAWLRKREKEHIDSLPREIEIELTTDDQLSDTSVRPRGKRLERIGCADPAAITRVVEEMAQYDDAAIVLGGFGEPLLHPRFSEIVVACRNAGIYALGVRTNALAMDEAVMEVLMKNEVDAVSVTLDAVDAAGYQQVHHSDAFEQAIKNVQRLLELRHQQSHVRPLVVPEMIKTADTYGTMEAFFDQWTAAAGWAIISGYSDYGGILEDRSVMNLAPPVRTGCMQIRRRAMMLSDGRLLACDQDPLGRHAIGNLTSDSLAELWRGERMRTLRTAHAGEKFDVLDICTSCTQWHRP